MADVWYILWYDLRAPNYAITAHNKRTMNYPNHYMHRKCISINNNTRIYVYIDAPNYLRGWLIQKQHWRIVQQF